MHNTTAKPTTTIQPLRGWEWVNIFMFSTYVEVIDNKRGGTTEALRGAAAHCTAYLPAPRIESGE
ncbi:hypothetical protein GCM10027419_51640 [Pandoraea terrae]